MTVQIEWWWTGICTCTSTVPRSFLNGDEVRRWCFATSLATPRV